jgi:hypothetical protein
MLGCALSLLSPCGLQARRKEDSPKEGCQSQSWKGSRHHLAQDLFWTGGRVHGKLGIRILVYTMGLQTCLGVGALPWAFRPGQALLDRVARRKSRCWHRRYCLENKQPPPPLPKPHRLFPSVMIIYEAPIICQVLTAILGKWVLILP